MLCLIAAHFPVSTCVLLHSLGVTKETVSVQKQMQYTTRVERLGSADHCPSSCLWINLKHSHRHIEVFPTLVGLGPPGKDSLGADLENSWTVHWGYLAGALFTCHVSLSGTVQVRLTAPACTLIIFGLWIAEPQQDTSGPEEGEWACSSYFFECCCCEVVGGWARVSPLEAAAPCRDFFSMMRCEWLVCA